MLPLPSSSSWRRIPGRFPGYSVCARWPRPRRRGTRTSGSWGCGGRHGGWETCAKKEQNKELIIKVRICFFVSIFWLRCKNDCDRDRKRCFFSFLLDMSKNWGEENLCCLLRVFFFVFLAPKRENYTPSFPPFFSFCSFSARKKEEAPSVFSFHSFFLYFGNGNGHIVVEKTETHKKGEKKDHIGFCDRRVQNSCCSHFLGRRKDELLLLRSLLVLFFSNDGACGPTFFP